MNQYIDSLRGEQSHQYQNYWPEATQPGTNYSRRKGSNLVYSLTVSKSFIMCCIFMAIGYSYSWSEKHHFNVIIRTKGMWNLFFFFKCISASQSATNLFLSADRKPEMSSFL